MLKQLNIKFATLFGMIGNAFFVIGASMFGIMCALSGTNTLENAVIILPVDFYNGIGRDLLTKNFEIITITFITFGAILISLFYLLYIRNSKFISTINVMLIISAITFAINIMLLFSKNLYYFLLLNNLQWVLFAFGIFLSKPLNNRLRVFSLLSTILLLLFSILSLTKLLFQNTNWISFANFGLFGSFTNIIFFGYVLLVQSKGVKEQRNE